MGEWRGYLAIENIALTNLQRATLVQELKQLGVNNTDSKPNRRNHWRISLNKDKVIFEAAFNNQVLVPQFFKNKLGNIFNVDPETIDAVITNTSFGSNTTVIGTFGRLGVDRVAFFIFGGPLATWDESSSEINGYFRATIQEWEGDIA